jgi:hypothetical protein
MTETKSNKNKNNEKNNGGIKYVKRTHDNRTESDR